jgi:hypothetical protein
VLHLDKGGGTSKPKILGGGGQSEKSFGLLIVACHHNEVSRGRNTGKGGGGECPSLPRPLNESLY